MPQNQHVRSMLRSGVGSDFEWCAGCGGPPRTLTRDELKSALENAQSILIADSVPLDDLMYEIEWLFETNQRGARCTCDPLSRLEVPSGGFHLYRLWGPGDRLLYVGVSRRLRARIRAHRRKLGDLITGITWEEHPDVHSMLEAERIAIRDEIPALNIVGIDAD